jgi:hypothetical protein
MSHEFPPEIAAVIQEKMPPHHKMWWLRCVVLDNRQVERPDERAPTPLRDLLVQVLDIDRYEGYDIRLKGAVHDIAEGDIISLLGHEPVEARCLSVPRLYINHNTGSYARVYPDASQLPYGRVPFTDWRFWLATKVPSNRWGKVRNFLVLLGMSTLFLSFLMTGWVLNVLLLILLLLFLPLMLLLLPTFLVFWYLNYLLKQPRFQNEPPTPPPIALYNVVEFLRYDRVDITALYEEVACALNAYVKSHPDEEKNFVAFERGARLTGALD